MTEPRSLRLVAIALLGLVALAATRVVVDGTWDDVAYHTEVAPPRLAAAAAVHAGHAPAWWDGVGLGVPLAAAPGHGAATPLAWLATTPHGLDVIFALLVACAAIGVALWARRLGASEAGAVLAGMFVAGAGLVATATLRGALPALALVPWVGWAAGSPSRRSRVALGALIGAIALAGQLGLLVDALVIAVACGATRPGRATLAAALVAGLAIGAALWLPAAHALAAGTGARLHALPLAHLGWLAVPGGIAGAWAPSLYLGAPVVALAAVRWPGARALAAIIAIAAFGLALGRAGGPAWLGEPALHLSALAIVLAAHAGRGIDALAAGEVRARALAGGAALLAAVAALGSHSHGAALAVALAVASAALVAAAVARPRAAWSVRVLVAVAALAPAPLVWPVTGRAVLDAPPGWARFAPRGAAPTRMYRPDQLFPHAPSVELAIATLAGASAAPWGLSATHTDDPARAPIYDRVWQAASYDGGVLLARFGIGLAVLPMDVVNLQHLSALGRIGNTAITHYPAAPPAVVMTSWQWLDERRALRDLFTDPSTAVLSGTGTASEEEPGSPAACAIDRWRAGAIDLTCTAALPAYAVVSSAAAPGWTASVDGRAAPVVTADLVRRAVAMPPGTHRIAWRYAAPGQRTGLFIAALGVLGLVGLGLIRRRALAG